MEYSKKAITTGIALVIGSVGIIHTASAVTFTFQNNAAATQPGTTLAGFAVNSEFHIATPLYGSLNNGDKDVISGGEQWIFNGNASGALMTGVANTDTNSGHSGTNGSAGLTSGVAGFPIASAPGTVATVQQGADFLGANFSVLAPLTGNIVGQTFGAAFVGSGSTSDFTQAGSFTITMPVVYVQWADGTIILGGDANPEPSNGDKCAANGPCPGPGVTFNGTTDGLGNFNLWASRATTFDELTTPGKSNSVLEWSLQGSYAASAVPVPAAAWLFGSGLAGIIGVARRRKK